MTIDRITPDTRRDTAAALLRSALQAGGIDTPDADARRLMQDVAGVDAAALIVSPQLPIGPRAAALADALARRLAREPVSRIIGARAFYKSVFRISPATLDPRPETETLVDAVLQTLRADGRTEEPLRLLDIGTGSGCILLSLLAELPRAAGFGSDISASALDVAAENAARLGLAERVQWVCVAADDPLAAYGSIGPVDVIVSNPPYIPSGAIEALEPEVRLFDPRIALDGGADGLAMYRHIAHITAMVLTDGGCIFLEVGAGQAGKVEALLRDIPGRSAEVRTWPDLGDVGRCVAARIRYSSRSKYLLELS